MAVADVFKVYLYADPLVALDDVNYPFPQSEEITSGIISVDIVEGTDTYEGPQEQIDTGQFTIVTRNPAMDPKINLNLKYNSTIKFYDERSGEFFRGYVTDVQVQYQREDDPIITITGTDIFGAAQRVVVDQDTHDAIMALSTGPTWNGITFSEFIPYMTDFTSKYLDLDAITPPGYPAPAGFWFDSSQAFAEESNGNLAYSPAKYIPEVGETYLDVINKYAQTNLTSFTAKGQFGYDYINVYTFLKYNPQFWAPQSDPMLTYTTYDFSSDPADGKPYETILIDNGYNRVINQVSISNEYRYVDAGELKSESEGFTRISSESIQDYAISRASISTIYPEDAALANASWANGYSTNIFQVTQFPGQEIQQITFNNARYEDVQNNFTYSDYALNQMIRIKHEINNNETIDRVYDIAGITHNISPDKWEMGFTLKPAQEEIVFNYQGSIPTLQMNSLSGDSNFNFTATLVDYDPTTVSGVVWALSATEPDEIALMWPYATNGQMFKNGVVRTGSTQTWNFDDDGILAPYSFDSVNYPPVDNRYGGYGVGSWTVYAFIQLVNGFTIVLQKQLTVGTPVVTANFGWAQNLTNNFGQVNFTNTSTNHETGEYDSYAWTFGDGTTSALANPVKVYDPAPGQTTYSASLTVFAYGAGGVKVYNTHTETVTLVQPAMTADYTFTTSNSTVTFLNTSTNVGYEEPDAYLWNFGDGTTSTEKNPVKTYSGFEGQTLSYNVQLTTRNIWEQTASVTKAVSFTITFTVGNYGVTYIRLRPAQGTNYLSGKRFTPYMFNFKGLASQTNANLLYLKNTYLMAGANQTWTNKSAGIVLQTAGFNNEINTTNLTGEGGLSGLAAGNHTTGGIPYQLQLNWFNTDTPKFNLKDFALTLRDVIVGSTEQWHTIFVDIFTNFGFVEIGFFAIGKGPVGKNILGAAAGITEEERKITLTRILPINTLGFNYTFNNNSYTANFTAGFNADSYLWQFGDGTTSTLANPTKTFSSRGIKYVTINATTNGVTTSITEPVNVLPVFPYNFRYIRIKQKLHDGTHQWDTPYIANLKTQTATGSYVSTGGLTNPQSICSKRITDGTAWSPSYTGATTFDPLNSQNLTNNTGLRFSTTNAGNTSEWDVVVDYKEAVATRIHNITLDAAVPTVSGFAPTVAAGISYEIFTTPYTGTFASATNPDNIGGGATWTKIGEINPTGMLQNKLTTYNLIPS